MPIKKSELYGSLWKSCDELRGGMDASQYKDYVLVLLFVKYVSDKYAGQKDVLFQVPEGGSFNDMAALKGDKEIGDKINKIIAKLAEKNELKGIIDVADFNDADKLGKGKEMVDRLSRLVGIFSNPALDFRSNRAEGDDILGDAYEYLMRHFATESGKSKGQFYTPAEVSRVMAKVIGLSGAKAGDQTIYDPTCGSGSLLLKAHDEARSRTGWDLTLYGQEMDNATSALARMNMILHNCPTAEIWKDNTLSSPHFKQPNGQLKTFDFVVANPPFSTKAWSHGFKPEEDVFKRFEYGVPPEKNGDYAFLLHVLASLKSTGKGAIILPHGVLFRGGAEAQIRKNIVPRGLIRALIGLPPNLFYGTGIPACILVLDKENAHARKGIFMIDASKGFVKDGNKNRLRERDIHKMVDAFSRGLSIERFSRMVPRSEIEANDYNLNLPRYIDSSEPEDVQDIGGHLWGGIPHRDVEALEDYWQVFPGLRELLFEAGDRAGFYRLRVGVGEIKTAINTHGEFQAFQKRVMGIFEQWRAGVEERLRGIGSQDKPKVLGEAMAESLLAAFSGEEMGGLVDGYAVYQHWMDGWAAYMQDDFYLIVQEGWKAILEGKANEDLIPRDLVMERYFAKERASLEALEGEREGIARQMEEMEEEHGGEDGLLWEAKTEKGKLTKASVKERLGRVMYERDAKEELFILKEYMALLEREAVAGKRVKDAERVLEGKVLGMYSKLGEGDIKYLVVGEKWLRRLRDAVEGELGRVSGGLAGRVGELAERYGEPLNVLRVEVDMLSGRVAEHLRRMGFGEGGVL